MPAKNNTAPVETGQLIMNFQMRVLTHSGLERVLVFRALCYALTVEK